MGDAQDAATEPEPSSSDSGGSRPGLFRRLLHAVSPNSTDEHSVAERPVQTAGVPGLGQLRNLRVEEVMLPRAEIVAVSVNTKKDELIEVFRESGLTRLPVYKETLDEPLGLVHLKDLALQHGFNGTNGRFSLRSMLRPLLYAPPSMPIGVLLQKMQTERMHMALVIDEYGGVDGLVTIEDLIEQVVGEIEDEHDTEEAALWVEEAPGCYSAAARAPLDEFEVEIGRKLVAPEDAEEVDTLGGLVFMLAGRVPARGEVIHHPDGPDFEVIDADPRRIKRLRVRLSGARRT